jgi:hypothetical protein
MLCSMFQLFNFYHCITSHYKCNHYYIYVYIYTRRNLLSVAGCKEFAVVFGLNKFNNVVPIESHAHWVEINL